jgi:hypothetical protein
LIRRQLDRCLPRAAETKTVQCKIATPSRIHSNHPLLRSCSRSRSRSLHEPHPKNLFSRELFFFLKTRTDGFGNTLSNISLDSLHASRRFYNHVLFSSHACSTSRFVYCHGLLLLLGPFWSFLLLLCLLELVSDYIGLLCTNRAISQNML